MHVANNTLGTTERDQETTHLDSATMSPYPARHLGVPADNHRAYV